MNIGSFTRQPLVLLNCGFADHFRSGSSQFLHLLAMDSHTAATPRLQVGIVGAGVAGLSAAIALRRIGHNVEASYSQGKHCDAFLRSAIGSLADFRAPRSSSGHCSGTKTVLLFPSHPMVDESSNNGDLTPSKLVGLKIFRYAILSRSTPPYIALYLYHSESECGVTCSCLLTMYQVRRPKGDTLEPMAPTLSFANVEQQFGNKWYFYHRVDMHRHLRVLAEAAGSTIRLGAQVIDVDPESGMIFLKNGSQTQKDLVIIADGQHVSVALSASFPSLIRPSGSTQRQNHREGSTNETKWPDSLPVPHPYERYPRRRRN